MPDDRQARLKASTYLGRLQAHYECTCAGCENTVLGLGTNKAKAEKDLREHHGWRLVKGFWHCADCAPGTR